MLCLKSFLLCNAYDDFFEEASLTVGMDIGQKCCFVHAYVRIRSKCIYVCV